MLSKICKKGEKRASNEVEKAENKASRVSPFQWGKSFLCFEKTLVSFDTLSHCAFDPRRSSDIIDFDSFDNDDGKPFKVT